MVQAARNPRYGPGRVPLPDAERVEASSQVADDRLEALIARAVVADGDYGDIIVSAGMWMFDPTVVTSYALTLLAAANAGAARTVLGLGALAVLNTVATAQIDNLAVTNGKVANTTLELTKLADLPNDTLVGSLSGSVNALRYNSPGRTDFAADDWLWHFTSAGVLKRETVQNLLDLIESYFGLTPP